MSPAPDDTGLPARRAALAALQAVETEDAYSNLVVPESVADLAGERDRAFASYLAYETLRWEGTLDWLLAQVLTRPLDDVEPALRRILRLGALQLFRSAVPARAAVSTAAALAREAVPAGRAKGAAGFVNGVLRALARRLDDLAWPDPAADRVAHLRLVTAHPDWVVDELLGRLGPADTEALLRADNEPPGLTLRAEGDRDALVAELQAQGLAATPGEHSPEAVHVPGGDPRRIPAVAEGRATPQDEASMLVAHATGVGQGDRVLDLCAGPGGKATHLARMVGPAGTVTAVELHPHRAALVRQAAQRLGVAVDVRVGDAANPPVEEGATYDAVLLDAPCTGLGTGRRRPEVRWRRTRSDIGTLAALQRRLVDAAAALVRPGGTLVYAVCTWTHEETGGVADAFEAGPAGAGFTRVAEQQLLPHREGTDGMYTVTYRRDSVTRRNGGPGGRLRYPPRGAEIRRWPWTGTCAWPRPSCPPTSRAWPTRSPRSRRRSRCCTST